MKQSGAYCFNNRLPEIIDEHQQTPEQHGQAMRKRELKLQAKEKTSTFGQ